MNNKICHACKIKKKLSEFYSDIRSECKECERSRQREYYKKNRAKVKERVTARWRNSLKAQEYDRNRYLNPKVRARYSLREAVLVGKIKKKPCLECGKKKVNAHHYKGYEPENWFNVQWLCTTHHGIKHRINERKVNGL